MQFYMLMAALVNFGIDHLQRKTRNIINKATKSAWILEYYKVIISASVHKRNECLRAQYPLMWPTAGSVPVTWTFCVTAV